MQTVAGLYGVQIDDKSIDESFASATRDEQIDFGVLDESYQKEIIARIMTDTSAATTLIQKNPFLAQSVIKGGFDRLIEMNCRAVTAEYNNTIYQKALMDVYKRVAGIKVSHHLSSIPLLKYFLNSAPFGLLKWCPYVEG